MPALIHKDELPIIVRVLRAYAKRATGGHQIYAMTFAERFDSGQTSQGWKRADLTVLREIMIDYSHREKGPDADTAKALATLIETQLTERTVIV